MQKSDKNHRLRDRKRLAGRVHASSRLLISCRRWPRDKMLLSDRLKAKSFRPFVSRRMDRETVVGGVLYVRLSTVHRVREPSFVREGG